MGNLTIDCQLVTQTCECCGATYDVSQGSVYESGVPFGIYLAAMHGCKEKLLFLAIAIVLNADTRETCAAALMSWPTETEIRMAFTDPEESPWHARSPYVRPAARSRL